MINDELAAERITLDEREKAILIRALTGRERIRGVARNHVYAAADTPTIESLIKKGLMVAGAAPYDDGYRYYHCTEAGAAAVGLRLPK